MNRRPRQRNKTLGVFLGRLFQLLLRLIMATCRFTFHDHAQFETRSRQGRFIFLFFRDRLALVEPFLRRFGGENAYTAAVAYGREGDIIEGMTKAYKQTRVIRMPTQHRHVSLRKVIEALNCHEVVMMAADGDGSKSGEVEPGIAFTAKTACAPIIPFSFKASRYWVLKRWDRMIIPMPFSHIEVTVGAPISITRDDAKASSQMLAEKLRQLDDSLPSDTEFDGYTTTPSGLNG